MTRSIPVYRLYHSYRVEFPEESELPKGAVLVGSLVETEDGYCAAYRFTSRRPILLGEEFETAEQALRAFYHHHDDLDPPPSRIKQRIAVTETRVVWCGSTRMCACGKNKFHFGYAENRSRHCCQYCGSTIGIVQCCVTDEETWLHADCERAYLEKT